MFYDKASKDGVTLIMHYQGIGGPPAAYRSFMGPEILLRHGLSKVIQDTGFSNFDMVSALKLYPAHSLREELEIAEDVGKRFGKKQSIKFNSGRELVGFPFSLSDYDYILASTKHLETPAYHIRSDGTSVEEPLENTIYNLQLLRHFHTGDFLVSLSSLIKGNFIVHVAGTHDGDIGAVSAVSTYFRRMGLRVGLVSFDAHGDYNSFQISPSGNLHGMHNAIYTFQHMRKEGYLAFLGSRQQANPERKVSPRNVLHVGGRQFDPLEKLLLVEDGVVLFSMREIEYAKSQSHLERTFEEKYLRATDGIDAVIVSIDFDVLDPDITEVKPDRLAVTYQEPNGLRVDDLRLMLRQIAKNPIPVAALLVSELNPRSPEYAQLPGLILFDSEEKSFNVATDVVHDFLLANRK